MTTSVEWDYFLSIEEDFIRTIPFVEPREGNFDTYSTQYAKILLAAASETDTVLKRLCKTIDPSCRKKSEQGYREFLVKGKRVPLLNAKAKSLRFGLSSTPWASYDFDNPQTPEWWTAYNKVKHHLDEGFRRATLRNTFDAMCGLFVSLLFLYETEGLLQLSPAPRLLDVEEGFRAKRTRLISTEETALLLIANLPDDRRKLFEDAFSGPS